MSARRARPSHHDRVPRSRVLRARPSTVRPHARADHALGSVPVTDLFVALVDHHGFAAQEAVLGLVIGLREAGYPDDAEEVAAVDAMDVLSRIVGDGFP